MRRALSTPLSLGEIAAALGAELRGDPAVLIHRLASLRGADDRSIGFLARAQQREAALESRAAALLVSPALDEALASRPNRLLHPQPYLAYARLAQIFDARLNPRPAAGVAAGALIDPSAIVSPLAIIDSGAVVGARSRIGERAWIGANCVVGDDCSVGADARLHPNVSLLSDCHVGERTLIHSGTVIGADGFGFAPQAGGGWLKIPQLGGVVIGADVEIGANCCIDRGALDDTVIEDGCKLDNLIQIAHNVRIGAQTAIAACAGVAGSAVIGKRCQIGGASGIAGHITVCDDTIVSTMTLISRSITKPGFFSGIFPSMENAQWERAAVVVRQLPEMRRRLRRLEQTVAGTTGTTGDAEGASPAGARSADDTAREPR